MKKIIIHYKEFIINNQQLLIGTVNNKIIYLGINLDDLQKIYKPSKFTYIADKLIDLKIVSLYLERYFAKENINLNFDDFLLMGTELQILVWKYLTKIPLGESKTYQEIASSIGHTKAVRSVATAVGKNPIIFLIPCHRIVGKKDLWLYRSGKELKLKIWKFENITK